MGMMTRVPPPWIRLFIVTPIVFVGCGLVTLLSPILHVILALVDLVDRKHWRFSRMGGLAIALCVTEFLGLIAVFILWVSAGFGLAIRTELFQHAHNRVFGWWLELVTRALCFYLDFDFEIQTTERVTGPVLTFARHAGPGDSLLLARTVIRDYRRQLRMLGTTKLLWDPLFDHLLRRMPYHFCDQNPRNAASDLVAITEMSASMDADSVLIIFPEGGNWTPKRWAEAIDRLEERGMHDRAVRAAGMRNVLPPRSAGAVAALSARPDLSVVFVAHAGLEDLISLGEIWRQIPLRRQVTGAYWSVPSETIPSDRASLSPWLFDQWELVDKWITEHRSNTAGR